MYTCQQCFKDFYSWKSFDGHIKVLEDGPLECDQCGKTSKLSGSYRNHMKAHKNEYVCEHQGCEKVHHSYTMHRECRVWAHRRTYMSMQLLRSCFLDSYSIVCTQEQTPWTGTS